MDLLETQTKDEFKIKLEVFEGPFDLLLHLVDEQKVAIYDISISKITEAYLTYIHQLKELDLDLSGEFMVMAALLIEMKSKMLLPSANPDNEELLAEAEAEKRALLEKLVEYKAFKNLTAELVHREAENLYVHTREHINQEIINQSPAEQIIHLKNVSMDDLLKAFNRVWQDFELRALTHDFSHLSNRVVSIRETMQNILSRLHNNHGKIMFSELFVSATSRFDIIATFIGLLELARQQFITLQQSDLFDDIELTQTKTSLERQIELDENEYNKIQGVEP